MNRDPRARGARLDAPGTACAEVRPVITADHRLDRLGPEESPEGTIRQLEPLGKRARSAQRALEREHGFVPRALAPRAIRERAGEDADEHEQPERDRAFHSGPVEPPRLDRLEQKWRVENDHQGRRHDSSAKPEPERGPHGGDDVQVAQRGAGPRVLQDHQRRGEDHERERACPLQDHSPRRRAARYRHPSRAR